MVSKDLGLLEGQAAPDFELKDGSDKVYKLSDFRGKTIVLYFYPKDDTPGCTKEACNFRDNIDLLQGAGAVLFGISLDDAESHNKFIDKYKLNFTILCDIDAKVSRLYRVYKKKNIYSKLFWGIERSTFIINPDGNIKKIFRKVKVEGHTEEVLAAVRS